ncbi:DUF6087 family protein (plasmid) [Streptomyces sp. NBC_00445]|uniref:DUF6087 family protein n=1 Tax=Streptomyces sp. NBC_00445 TaxID=2975745 RepID=UPI002E1A5095
MLAETRRLLQCSSDRTAPRSGRTQGDRGVERQSVVDGAVVDDLAAAKRLLCPPQPVEEEPAEWGRPVLGRGRGRHRKPSPSDEQNC